MAPPTLQTQKERKDWKHMLVQQGWVHPQSTRWTLLLPLCV
jgi:hypothetical protein